MSLADSTLAPNGVPRIVKHKWSQDECRRWFDSLPTRPARANEPEDIYQRIHAGNTEYRVSGGDQSYWADGIERRTALNAKMVVKAEISPFIEGSGIGDYIRRKIERKLRDEFYRAGQVLHDAGNPLTSLRIITNDVRAVNYFERLMREYNVPGEAVVAAATDLG